MSSILFNNFCISLGEPHHYQPSVVSKIINQDGQCPYLLFIWIVVGTINKGNLLPEVVFCHCFISYKHKLLYNFRSLITFIGLYLYWLAFFIYNNFALWEFKVNSSLVMPLFFKNLS